MMLNVTTELVQPEIDPDIELTELFESSSGSVAGFHAISSWLTCPEQARLRALGVRPKAPLEPGDDCQLSALDFGTLVHHLRAIRIVHGNDVLARVLGRYKTELHPEDHLMVTMMFAAYESTYPLEQDRNLFEVLGVEVEVVTDIALPGSSPILRSVRYDTLIRSKAGEVFSFEAKTMSRSGTSSLNPYLAQAMVQQAIWNANPALVQRYGRMHGVLFDCFIKTKAPSVDRVGPRYFGRVHEDMALNYMRLPENGSAVFTVQPDGTYPKMLHACYGRWRPCDYVTLCHDRSYGEYEYRDGSPFLG
jgi:hypothetical protein